MLTAVSRALRALISTAPWAAERLRPFQGSTLLLEVGGVAIPLIIDAEGYPALSRARPERPDLTLRIPFQALPDLVTDKEAALRQLHLEGNSGLAHEVGFLARHFRPDLEELLSRFLGDIAAHRIAEATRAGRAWARDSLRRLAASGSEYVTEEARWVASRSSLNQFTDSVRQLNEAVNRLEERVARLG
jgi:ubiquinone biosynthesis protein UbiJ